VIYRDFHLELHQDNCLDPDAGGRFLIVGDVHGQKDMLMRLMEHAGYDPKVDQVIAVGDLVDPVAGVYWQVGHGEDQQWGPTPLPAPVKVSLPKNARKRRRPHE